MTQISGGKLSGMRLDGAAFMSPMDLGASIWLRRGMGITIATGVSQWNDQSGNNRHFAQATGADQPTYNAGTGIVTFNAANTQLLRLGSNVPVLSGGTGELFLVVRFPITTGGGCMWSIDSNTVIDADNYSFYRTSGKLRFNKAVTASNESISLTSAPDATWMIVSAKNDGTLANLNRMFINGQEVQYTKQGLVAWISTPTRMYLGAEARNSGGVETTPVVWGTFDIVDFAFFDDLTLNNIQRSRLVSYYRHEYPDLLT